ncbi:MAG TPA: thioesterase family protein [Chthonomonadaceae bacterium]|nr:thioesterase family protein [Chthonomonadaceae bacterium]
MARQAEKQACEGSDYVGITVRVRYAETDQMGIVHHANYLIWFEAARSAFCRERGIDYAQMERDGMILPLMEAHCRYLRPAHYEEEIVVRSRVVELRRSLLRIEYAVERGAELLATGETLQMLLDRETRKPKRFPQELAARFLENRENNLSTDYHRLKATTGRNT